MQMHVPPRLYASRDDDDTETVDSGALFIK